MRDVRAPRRLVAQSLAGLGIVWVVWRWLAGGTTTMPPIVPPRLPLYALVCLAIFVLNAVRWRAILRRVDADQPLGRLVRFWLAGRAVGSLVPSGTLAGEPVRAGLLVSSGVPTSTAAGSVALDRALEMAGNVIAGPVCVAAALAFGARSHGSTAVAMTGAAMGLASLAFVYARARRGAPALAALLPPARLLGPRRTASWRAAAARVDAALADLLRTHPGLVPAGVALSLGIECLRIAEMAALFAVFDLAVPLPLLLLSSIGIGVARAVPVSAALGALELTQVGIFALGGRPLADGLTVGLALRAAETLWILVGLGCLALAGARDAALSGNAAETGRA